MLLLPLLLFKTNKARQGFGKGFVGLKGRPTLVCGRKVWKKILCLRRGYF
jgi:hypothetical protein